MQDEFLLEETKKLDQQLKTILENFNTNMNKHQFAKTKENIILDLLTQVSDVRERIAITLTTRQISSEKYETHFNDAIKILFPAENSQLFTHRNELVKFFNLLTRPLSWIFGALSHNTLLKNHGFFLTKSSKNLIEAGKKVLSIHQPTLLNFKKP